MVKWLRDALHNHLVVNPDHSGNCEPIFIRQFNHPTIRITPLKLSYKKQRASPYIHRGLLASIVFAFGNQTIEKEKGGRL